MADTTDDTNKPAAEKTPVPARRRAPRKPSTAKTGAAKTAAKKVTSPRAPRTAPQNSKRAAVKTTASKAVDSLEKASGTVGGKWGAAAIAGGLAAVGAAAALLSLRGSTEVKKSDKKADRPAKAAAKKIAKAKPVKVKPEPKSPASS